MKLKKIKDQVIVITGASSGIGLTTSRIAAQKGAKVMLSSRNEQALEQICYRLRLDGCEVDYFVADVTKQKHLQQLASETVKRFGRIDTWVNNAGVSFYGRIEEIPIEVMRRIFEVDFWGLVYGSMAAIPHLRSQGGALVNIGSEVSKIAIPLQGPYVAAKHAVKGFTDSLRLELEADGTPISVTLIKPASIDTAFTKHAGEALDVQPTLPAPVYAPDAVAHAILFCAEHPRREVFVGGAAKFFSLLETFAPRLTDFFVERTMFKMQKSNLPVRKDEEALFGPAPHEGFERGEYSGHTFESSLYTSLALRPILATFFAGVSTAAFVASLLGPERAKLSRKMKKAVNVSFEPRNSRELSVGAY
jgi:short-subunit dehydrogenase